MDRTEEIKKVLTGFPEEFYSILATKGKFLEISSNQLLLKEGYFVNTVPIVLEGILKVTRKDDEKEILLYYINPGESCIMSFSACITNTTSKVFAATEMQSKVLLISTEMLQSLIKRYPLFTDFFFKLYQIRYEELIGAIDQLVFKKFDERLYRFLVEKADKTGKRILHITHQEIAQDMGTVREVVSRTLKKLEKEGKLKLTRNEIQIFRDM